jgi:hypothetical protein
MKPTELISHHTVSLNPFANGDVWHIFIGRKLEKRVSYGDMESARQRFEEQLERFKTDFNSKMKVCPALYKEIEFRYSNPYVCGHGFSAELNPGLEVRNTEENILLTQHIIIMGTGLDNIKQSVYYVLERLIRQHFPVKSITLTEL